MEERKKDHIDLAFKSKTTISSQDNRFVYEPILSEFPGEEEFYFEILGKEIHTPIWASSMTGGTENAKNINTNIARVCNKHKMGMGLGSCRIILKDDTHFDDFNMREHIGFDQPLLANLGIAQVEDLLKKKDEHLIEELIRRLKADGLIIHVNPFQEWLQPEGNKIKQQPLKTIKKLISKATYPIMVKEVGQGFGPESLQALLELPLETIEFGSFGGTNFSMLEMLRNNAQLKSMYTPFAHVGQNAYQMVQSINEILKKDDKLRCQNLIISGGIQNFLDGYYLTKAVNMPAMYGMAASILEYALKGYDQLDSFIEMQFKGFMMAQKYLRINKNFPEIN